MSKDHLYHSRYNKSDPVRKAIRRAIMHGHVVSAQAARDQNYIHKYTPAQIWRMILSEEIGDPTNERHWLKWTYPRTRLLFLRSINQLAASVLPK
jgi:hypothetical protein